jgi:hypothetical protein
MRSTDATATTGQEAVTRVARCEGYLDLVGSACDADSLSGNRWLWPVSAETSQS